MTSALSRRVLRLMLLYFILDPQVISSHEYNVLLYRGGWVGESPPFFLFLSGMLLDVGAYEGLNLAGSWGIWPEVGGFGPKVGDLAGSGGIWPEVGGFGPKVGDLAGSGGIWPEVGGFDRKLNQPFFILINIRKVKQ